MVNEKQFLHQIHFTQGRQATKAPQKAEILRITEYYRVLQSIRDYQKVLKSITE